MPQQSWRRSNCCWREQPEVVHRLRQDQTVLKPRPWSHPMGLSCLSSLSSPPASCCCLRWVLLVHEGLEGTPGKLWAAKTHPLCAKHLRGSCLPRAGGR